MATQAGGVAFGESDPVRESFVVVVDAEVGVLLELPPPHEANTRRQNKESKNRFMRIIGFIIETPCCCTAVKKLLSKLIV